MASWYGPEQFPQEGHLYGQRVAGSPRGGYASRHESVYKGNRSSTSAARRHLMIQYNHEAVRMNMQRAQGR